MTTTMTPSSTYWSNMLVRDCVRGKRDQDRIEDGPQTPEDVPQEEEYDDSADMAEYHEEKSAEHIADELVALLPELRP